MECSVILSHNTYSVEYFEYVVLIQINKIKSVINKRKNYVNETNAQVILKYHLQNTIICH